MRDTALRSKWSAALSSASEDRMHLFVCKNNAMQLDRAIYNYKRTLLYIEIMDSIGQTQEIRYLG